MGKRNTSKTVTIKDIAAMCDVSISTVSNVINGKSNKVSKEVAEKIQHAFEVTGYKPNYLAKSLRATSTRTIGVIVEDLVVFSTAPIIEGLTRYCEEHEYSVVIENMRLFGRWSNQWMNNNVLYESALDSVLSKMRGLNVDGVIYIGGYEHTISLAADALDVPIVVAYSKPLDENIPYFILDDEDGGYIAYKHLLDSGHTRIGIITGEADNMHTINRLRGIQRAMFEAGQLFDPTLIEYCTWNREGGYAGMSSLINKDVTAVFCFSDQIAAGAYDVCGEHGIRPGDRISIVGYDNRDICDLLAPKLSTVALPLEEIGEAAGECILNICNETSETPPVDHTLAARIKGWFVERDSIKTLN